MKKIKCIIRRVDNATLAHKPDLIVNGQSIRIEDGQEVEVAEGIVEAAEASDRFTVERIDDTNSPAEDSGDGDGAAAQPGGSAAGGANSAQKSDAPDRSTTDIVEAEGNEPTGDAAGAEPKPAEDVTEEDLTRLQATHGDAEDAKSDFDAASVIKGNLSGKDGVEARIGKLETEEQLDAVLKAEDAANDGKDGRAGVKNAVEARRAELKEGK